MPRSTTELPRATAGRRVALATGGTAGHVTPALAVADAYRAAHPDVALLLLGSTAGWEQQLVTAHGYHLETLPAAPIYGVTAFGRLRALSSLAAGIRSARRVLQRDGVQLVIGFGGYASAGAVLGARSLGLATAVHEANALPGLANRMLAHVVDRVLLGWDGTAPYRIAGAFDSAQGGRRLRTGTPIRADLAGLADAPRRPLEPPRVCLLVCGGSQGSPFLNRHAPELAGILLHNGLAVELRHLSGREDPDTIRASYAAHGVAAEVQPHAEDMAAAYRWADFAVTCAGAVTLAELAAASLPALLVPLATASDDHQRDNAAGFAAATGAPWVPEDRWDSAAVGDRLSSLLRNRAAWRALSERIGRLAHPDAAAAVVAECEALLALRGYG